MLPMQTLSRHEGSVNCVVIHKDLLLSGSEDMEIKVCIITLVTFGFKSFFLSLLFRGREARWPEGLFSLTTESES